MKLKLLIRLLIFGHEAIERQINVKIMQVLKSKGNLPDYSEMGGRSVGSSVVEGADLGRDEHGTGGQDFIVFHLGF